MNSIGMVIITTALLIAPYLNNLILLIFDVSRLSHNYIIGNKSQVITDANKGNQFSLINENKSPCEHY